MASLDLRRRKWLEYNRERGLGFRMTAEEAAPARAKLHEFRSNGMSFKAMGKSSGVPPSTLTVFAKGGLGNHHSQGGIQRDHYNAIMRMEFVPPPPGTWHRMGPRDVCDISLIVRRLVALRADGWTVDYIVEQLPCYNASNIQKICRGEQKLIGIQAYQAICDLYDKLKDANPLDAGISPRAAKVAKAYVRGAPGAACWDWDTIDDPNAIPEWTGACGTPDGYRIHLRESIAMCPACLEAIGQVETAGVFSPTKFRILIEQSGLTPVQLAEKVGATRDSIARWSAGERNPQPKYIGPMCEALNCVEADLFEADGEIIYDKDFNKEKFVLTMKAKGFSKRQLALRIGISNMAVHYWCDGTNTPKIPKIVKAAEILGVDWKDFYR